MYTRKRTHLSLDQLILLPLRSIPSSSPHTDLMSGCSLSLSLSDSLRHSVYMAMLCVTISDPQKNNYTNKKTQKDRGGKKGSDPRPQHQATSGGGGRFRSRSMKDFESDVGTGPTAEDASVSFLTDTPLTGKKLFATGWSNRQISSGFRLTFLNASK